MADFGMEITLSHAQGFPVITGCSLGGAEIYLADVTLNDEGEAAMITIFAHGSSVPCFESRVLGAGADAGPDKVATIAALPPAEIGRQLNRIVGDGHLRAPDHARKRQIVEHFRALA
jgi:hypothetical protein